jgi:hypothetical protein
VNQSLSREAGARLVRAVGYITGREQQRAVNKARMDANRADRKTTVRIRHSPIIDPRSP